MKAANRSVSGKKIKSKVQGVFLLTPGGGTSDNTNLPQSMYQPVEGVFVAARPPTTNNNITAGYSVLQRSVGGRQYTSYCPVQIQEEETVLDPTLRKDEK